MVIETIPKDILDKLEAGVKVVNPAGAGLTIFSYGSSDGGTTWFPVKVSAAGVVSVDATFTDPWKTIVDTGTLIQRSNGTANGFMDIYEVPANKVLYITAASVRGFFYTAGINNPISLQMANWTALSVQCEATVGQTESLSISFSLPVKLIATQKVVLNASGTGISGNGGFTGYLVDA